MHDVSVQPDRADTWAAMALARKSRLENKLNAVVYITFFLLSSQNSFHGLFVNRITRSKQRVFPVVGGINICIYTRITCSHCVKYVPGA